MLHIDIIVRFVDWYSHRHGDHEERVVLAGPTVIFNYATTIFNNTFADHEIHTCVLSMLLALILAWLAKGFEYFISLLWVVLLFVKNNLDKQF
jgi:hypothetical protein